MQIPTWTSLLFVPADNAALIAKAGASEAGAVILDLEDGVGEAAKPAARARIADSAKALAAAGRGVAVRINASWRAALMDLEACAGAPIDAIVVPKTTGARQLETLREMIGEFGAAPAPGLIALIEAPEALARLGEIAACAGVVGLALGPEDFCLALGVAPTPAALDLPCRQIALAAAARGLLAAATPCSIAAFRDADGFAAALAEASAYGANAALCIHPAQVRAANAALTPAPDACAAAARLLEAWRAAQAQGEDVIAFEGRMIDAPVAAQAQRLLARARRG